MIKFRPIDKDGGWYTDPTGYGWVGHPDCDRPTDDEKTLIGNRGDLEFISGISDPDPCYDYHEYVVVKLKGSFYLCETSGCSCPSPSETWSAKKMTEADIIQYFLTDKKEDLPSWVIGWNPFE